MNAEVGASECESKSRRNQLDPQEEAAAEEEAVDEEEEVVKEEVEEEEKTEAGAICTELPHSRIYGVRTQIAELDLACDSSTGDESKLTVNGDVHVMSLLNEVACMIEPTEKACTLNPHAFMFAAILRRPRIGGPFENLDGDRDLLILNTEKALRSVKFCKRRNLGRP